MTSLHWPARLARILTLLPALLLASSLAADAPTPEQVVKQTAGQIVGEISSREKEFKANPAALHEVIRRDLLPALDMEYSARLILGRAGRDATPTQLQQFTDAMSTLLIERYATGLLEYRSEDQLQVMPTKGDLNERMTKVRTRVQLSSGKYVPVDYVFRKTADGWKAFDVVVEGISYVTTYRNQIAAEIQASGLDAVITRLSTGELQLPD